MPFPLDAANIPPELLSEKVHTITEPGNGITCRGCLLTHQNFRKVVSNFPTLAPAKIAHFAKQSVPNQSRTGVTGLES